MLNVAAKMMPSSSCMFEMTIHDFPISPLTPAPRLWASTFVSYTKNAIGSIYRWPRTTSIGTPLFFTRSRPRSIVAASCVFFCFLFLQLPILGASSDVHGIHWSVGSKSLATAAKLHIASYMKSHEGHPSHCSVPCFK